MYFLDDYWVAIIVIIFIIKTMKIETILIFELNPNIYKYYKQEVDNMF